MRERSLTFILSLGSILLGQGTQAQLTYQLDNTLLAIDVVVDSTRVNIPWEIIWGPDERLWITDGPMILRWDPIADAMDTLLVRPYGNGLGMALHPNFPNDPHVFAVFDTSAYYGGGQYCEVFRFQYDAVNDVLINDTVLLSYPHAGEHAGGRLLFDDTGNLLLTTADYWLDEDTLGHKKGKVLRFATDGSVPVDNPTPDHTWTRGHRNAQGLCSLPNGNIMISEHGQAGNNEINWIQPDRNYGWAVWDGNDCTNIYPDSCSSPTYVVEPPLITFFEPPAGTEFYTHTAIPEFTDKLLTGILWFTGLQVFSFNDELSEIVDNQYLNGGAWSNMVRIRDMAIHSDGSIYLITNDRQSPRIRRMSAMTTTGIAVHSLSKRKAWPNPTQDLIHVNGSQEFLRVLDLQGRQVQVPVRVMADHTVIDLSGSAPGTYLITSSHGVERVVKQ